MISDVLSDAVVNIRKTLNDPLYRLTYKDTRERIERLVEEMDSVRAVLDTLPPPATESSPVEKTFKSVASAIGLKRKPESSDAGRIALSTPPAVEQEPRQPGFDKLSRK